MIANWRLRTGVVPSVFSCSSSTDCALFPVAGELVAIEGRSVKIEALDGHRVESVRLLPLSEPPSAPTDATFS